MMNLSTRMAVVILGTLLLLDTVVAQNKELKVVASIKPVHSILAGLMAGTDGPDLLLGEGKLPFRFALSKQQEQKLKEADLLVWVGPELEDFLRAPLEELKARTRVVTLLDNPTLKILPSRWDPAQRDPYFWLDSRNMIILVNELTQVLMELDAPRAHLYRRNRDVVLARVAQMDRRLEYGYRGLKAGVGMAYYDTLQYFEQAYALKIQGFVAQSPLHGIDAERLLIGRAKLAEGYYACLITESGMAMPELQLLTGGVEVSVGELDSFGAGLDPGPDLYFELMEHNTHVLKRCLGQGAQSQNAPKAKGKILEPARIRGKFMLMDHNGQLVRETDLLGKYQLLYFGYTFCPDICPTALQVMSAALDQLGDKAQRIQPYFITVDPERDTVDVMRNYVSYFNMGLTGLTGSKTMTDRVARQYRVQYEKVVEEGRDPDLYLVDHTASVFLIAPDGTFITKFAHGISASQLVDKINEYVP